MIQEFIFLLLQLENILCQISNVVLLMIFRKIIMKVFVFPKEAEKGSRYSFKKLLVAVYSGWYGGSGNLSANVPAFQKKLVAFYRVKTIFPKGYSSDILCQKVLIWEGINTGPTFEALNVLHKLIGIFDENDIHEFEIVHVII